MFLIFIVGITPFLWGNDFPNVHDFFESYLNPNGTSNFPFFPWGGYIFAGTIFAIIYIDRSKKSNIKTLLIISIITGVFCSIAGHLFFQSGADPGITRANPFFFLQRLGYILAIFSLFLFYENKYGIKESIVSLIGKESLLIYWLHLQFIYRPFIKGENLPEASGNDYIFWEAILAAFIISLITIYAAEEWHGFKEKYRDAASIFSAAIVTALILIFLIF